MDNPYGQNGENGENGQCELASRRSIRAFYLREFLLIVAEGDLPTPCYEVEIEQNLLTVEPPEFVLKRCYTGGFCPEVITPYKESKMFHRRSRPQQIVVHHADGSDTVEVENLGEGSPLQDSLIASSKPGGDEAIGRSRNLSFDEAFADALRNLPPLDPHPDQMDVVIVDEIRGEFGGIAGFRDLVVKVRRLKGP